MVWSVGSLQGLKGLIRVFKAERLSNASLGFLGAGEAGTGPIVAIPHILWAFGQRLLIDILRYLHTYMSPRGYYQNRVSDAPNTQKALGQVYSTLSVQQWGKVPWCSNLCG